MNILLIVNDALRYDRVTPKYMPKLARFAAEEATTFTNFWSVSHCTDPAVTALLTGMWPDFFGLYTMLFERPDYKIPSDVKMLSEVAVERGYRTIGATNLRRWYRRGFQEFLNIAQYDNKQGTAFSFAREKIYTKDQRPWFMFIHDASCHSTYRGGSYDAACQAVDNDIYWVIDCLQRARLYDKTLIVITSDHGEGLGQMGVEQHGGSVLPFITHIPLIIREPAIDRVRTMGSLCQHVDLHWGLKRAVEGKQSPFAIVVRDYAHIAGRTPDTWHRAVTDGRQMLFKEQVNGLTGYHLIDVATIKELPLNMSMWEEARKHASNFGVDADTGLGHSDDDIIAERLKALGYFG